MSNDNARGSLIERAAEIYDFGAALRGRAEAAPVDTVEVKKPLPFRSSGSAGPPDQPETAGGSFTRNWVGVGPVPDNSAPVSADLPLPNPSPEGEGLKVAPAEIAPPPVQPKVASFAPKDVSTTLDNAPRRAGRVAEIDRERLCDKGFIVPDAAIGTLAEEFRLVKRQLLLRTGAATTELSAKDRMILVCSARPNEGKTFCAINLALSLASERDNEVLLVDADVARADVLPTLGLDTVPGLIDAIADPVLDVERLIVRTDIPKLSLLAAGTATRNDTELLSSARAAEVIASLASANPRRIVILDSAPALAASPASVLAHRVGRILMIVRADRTKESDLQEAIALLDGCPDISLLLNGASFFGSNRAYGSYYGTDQS